MGPNNEFLAEGEDGTKKAVEELSKDKKKGATKGTKTDELKVNLDEKLKVERLAQKDFIQTEIQKFNIADKAIAEWKEQYMGLVVTNVDDKENIEKATAAYKLVKDSRINVEKKRKELKASALTFGRAVDAEAKRITELIEPIEAHLEAQKNFIEAEKEKARAAKEEAQKARMTERTNRLLALGMVNNGETFELIEGEEKITLSHLDVKMLDEDLFNIQHLKAEILREKHILRIKEEQETARAEKERVEKIAAEQKAEADRLEKIRKEQEAQAENLKKQKAELEEQQRELERKKQKEAEIAEASAKVKKEAEDKAAKDKADALKAAEEKRLADLAAVEKVAKDKADAELKAKQDAETNEKAEKERLAKEESLKPDKLRIQDFANYQQGLKLPELTSEEGLVLLETIKTQHAAYIKWLHSLVDKLK